MFLDFLDKKMGKMITKSSREQTTYNGFYCYWREQLFERVMRLFVWENTNEIKPKEIEQRLILQGHCEIAKYKGKLTAFYGTLNGVTVYQDEFTHANIHSPIYSTRLKIDESVIVIDNNSLRNPVFDLINHYAMMLAHAEVSITNAMINMRDANGIPVVQTEKQKTSVNDYLGRRYNGQFGTITDLGSLGVEVIGVSNAKGESLEALLDAKAKLLNDFYSDIGVRSAFRKNSNTVTEEVEADTGLLLLNLSDMLEHRQKGAEAVNSVFGTNWQVHIAEELEMALEAPADDKEDKADEQSEDN
ncbi:MAG: hypothetical protein MJZ37_08545 [Bacilli bacterium]|nr:hypothetical protein [Bacilli bacterium]